MPVDVAVQDQERKTQATHRLWELMQEFDMEFVVEDGMEGVRHVNVMIDGCDTLIADSCNGFTASNAEQAYNCHSERLGEMS